MSARLSLRFLPHATAHAQSFFSPAHDYKYEIFSILTSARGLTIVILAGKCGSYRNSTTRFSENVVVAKTSYQMLEILSFCDGESA